jgi:hypothetical protein
MFMMMMMIMMMLFTKTTVKSSTYTNIYLLIHRNIPEDESEFLFVVTKFFRLFTNMTGILSFGSLQRYFLFGFFEKFC